MSDANPHSTGTHPNTLPFYEQQEVSFSTFLSEGIHTWTQMVSGTVLFPQMESIDMNLTESE